MKSPSTLTSLAAKIIQDVMAKVIPATAALAWPTATLSKSAFRLKLVFASHSSTSCMEAIGWPLDRTLLLLLQFRPCFLLPASLMDSGGTTVARHGNSQTHCASETAEKSLDKYRGGHWPPDNHSLPYRRKYGIRRMVVQTFLFEVMRPSPHFLMCIVHIGLWENGRKQISHQLPSRSLPITRW